MEDDCNVGSFVEVDTTVEIPPTLVELSSQADSVENFIQNLPLLNNEEAKVLEECTRGQSNNETWKLHSVGRITASTIHRVLTKVKSLQINKDSNVIPLLNELICISTSSAQSYIPSLQYGQEMEEVARKAYIEEMKRLKHKDFSVTNCGLFISKDRYYISASPDGLVSCCCCEKGLLEIKCPSSIANEKPTEANVSYLQRHLQENKLKHTHQYFSQMQTQMGITGRTWCDFFVYTSHGFHLERITFDFDYWQQLVEAADYFFVN